MPSTDEHGVLAQAAAQGWGQGNAKNRGSNSRRGPIRDFRLVIDKGKAGSLVSFCMDGVRKISPTQFEVRKTNFEPRRDLPVLIAEFHQPE